MRSVSRHQLIAAIRMPLSQVYIDTAKYTSYTFNSITKDWNISISTPFTPYASPSFTNTNSHQWNLTSAHSIVSIEKEIPNYKQQWVQWIRLSMGQLWYVQLSGKHFRIEFLYSILNLFIAQDASKLFSTTASSKCIDRVNTAMQLHCVVQLAIISFTWSLGKHCCMHWSVQVMRRDNAVTSRYARILFSVHDTEMHSNDIINLLNVCSDCAR